MANQHIIHRQKVRLRLSSARGSFELQKQAERIMLNEVNPAIDALLSEISPGNETIIIPALSIDIGKISPAGFEKEFTRKVMEEVRRQLPLAVNKSREDKGAGPSTLTPFEAFLFFLEKGFFPWWLESAASASWQTNIVHELRRRDSYLVNKLLEVLQLGYPVQRLVQQFPEEVVDEVIKTIAPALSLKSADLRRSFTHIFGPLFTDGFSVKKFNHHLIDVLLTAVKEKTAPSVDNIITAITHHWMNTSLRKNSFKDEAAFVRMLNQQITAYRTNPQNNTEAIIIKHTSSFISGYAAGDIRRPATSHRASNAKEPAPNAGEKDQDKPPTLSELVKKHPAEPIEEREATYINNSGLVLLHPFLPALFAELKLTGADKLLHEEQYGRAVSLLQFMATGSLPANESELVLNKILCGIPLNYPVALAEELSEEDKTEVHSLLSSVIQHWKALGNTSVEGLRETFLTRKGKLFKKEKDWWLVAERKTVDVLADKLPWGIGMIKLPWMKELLKTEWI